MYYGVTKSENIKNIIRFFQVNSAFIKFALSYPKVKVGITFQGRFFNWKDISLLNMSVKHFLSFII